MSIASWKKDHYPTPASRIKTIKGALNQARRKWSGFTKAELKRHGLHVSKLGRFLQDNKNNSFRCDALACALCHLSRDPELGEVDCGKCVLDCQEGHLSPWHSWTDDNNPAPMIAHIAAAIAAREGNK